MEFGRTDHVAFQRLDQRPEQAEDMPNLISQGRAAEVDAVAGEDFRLPVQRKMIIELRDQNVGQQARTETAARDRQAGRRLGDTLAAPARELRSDVLDHFIAAGFILQDLGAILAQCSHEMKHPHATGPSGIDCLRQQTEADSRLTK